MAYTYSQKQTILQKIFSKITKEFRFCKENKDFDELMEKYAVSFSEENTVIVSRNKSRVLVIGALAGNKSDYQLAAKKLGISERNIEFVDDYKKMHNFNTARLQYNEIYSDIIVGPVPHSMENLSGESSLVAAIQNHPEMYPKLGLASSNNSLKLTMSNFKNLLTETRYFQEAV